MRNISAKYLKRTRPMLISLLCAYIIQIVSNTVQTERKLYFYSLLRTVAFGRMSMPSYAHYPLPSRETRKIWGGYCMSLILN